MGAGPALAQEQDLLHYWWVMPREAPEHAPRVIRVIGAKGEAFEEVFDEEYLGTLKSDPALQQARLARQTSLRLEALALADELKAAGKSAVAAYEEAWTRVYSRRWLTADWRKGSSRLEDMLSRLASEHEDFQLTPEEEQWVLEALLEDDDRLDSEQGVELLRRLSRRLRAMGYGRFYSNTAVQDELMERFAESLRLGKESMAAYRDAFFKTNRDRIIRHTLRGYIAPWGMGAGGVRSYRQAPQKISLTTSTVNTQAPAVQLSGVTAGKSYAAPGLNDLPASGKNFLATAPSASAIGEDDEEKDDEKEDEEEKEKETPNAVATAPAGSSAAPRMMMRSFSLRSSAPATYAAEGDEAVTLPANAITSGTNTTFHTNTTVSGHNLTYGNHYAASWGPQNYSEVIDTWAGDITASISFDAWNGNTPITGTPDTFTLAGGNLYLGTGYTGEIVVSKAHAGSVLHAESLEYASATKRGGFLNLGSATVYAVYQVPGSGVFRYGRLTGGGELTLSNNAAAGNAVIYTFSDSDGSGWFSGTVRFGASCGGIVELDLGEDAATTAWQNTVFNLTPTGVGTDAYSISGSMKPAATILNIRNDIAIAGLEGGDATSTVTNEAPTTDISHTLTLGDSTTNTYTYSGTFNRPYYNTATNAISPAAPLNLTKIGSNTQVITQDVVADVPGNAALDGSLNVLTVQAGTLQFNGELEATKVHATGGLLAVGGNLTVTGGENTGSDTVALQITKADNQTEPAARVTVAGTTSAYNVNVLRGASLSTGSLSVSRILHIDGSGSRVDIKGADSQPGQLSMEQLYVSNAGALAVQGSLSATTGVDIGTGTGGASAVTVTGAFTTPDLRLRSHARLETGSSVQVGSGTLLNGQTHLHGGGEWEMTGTANTLTGTLYLEDTATNAFTFTGTGGTQSGAVVLTLPGVIDFARSGWDGTNATMNLNGVTLDFSRGVQLVNTGLTLKSNEGQTLTLASLSEGSLGWYQPAAGSVTVWGNNGLAYHALLGKDENHIILTIQHEIKDPVVVSSGSLVYLEMYSNASSPALPYKAYTEARYADSSWSGTSVEPSHLLKFSNIRLSENAGIYLGELDKSPAGTDYKADHHFGGNVNIVATDASGDAASLHGQLGTWGNWLLDGHLGGSGNLKIVAHHGNTGAVASDTANLDTNNDDSSETVDGVTTKTTVVTTVHGSASVFSFSNVEDPAGWFSGELGLANPGGGIVQLNVGNVNIAGKGDTRWDGVVLDLRCSSYTDASDASGETGTASAQVLGVVGDATVAGLRGNAASSVVAGRSGNSLVPNPTLTLGADTGETYTFSGSIGSGRFYTGGQAYSVTTTVTTTDSSGNTLSEPSSVTREHNFYTSRQGGLNLVKIGSSIQEFAGSSCLDQVDVQAGKLIFSGSDTVINDVIVHKGATLQTGAVSLGSATLLGGSTWITTAATPNSYETPVYLADVFGAGGAVSSITLNSNGKTWTPTMYLNMQDAGTWTENSGAIFALTSGTSLDLSNPRVITNMSGISGGKKIALYSGWTGTSTFADNLVMVEDTSGNFYDADYVLENGTLYLQLEETAGSYGIIINKQPIHTKWGGYVWSGEDNGTIIAKDVHYMSLVLGSVWRADGSAENTGWHEQRAVGSTNDEIGVYENGNAVYFLDTNVHGDEEAHRKVIIQGQVAPGEIVVDTSRNLGYVGTAWQEAQMQYAYAFVAGDDTACITDFGDKATSITKRGTGLLVLNLANTFTGGIDVQDGGLYLAAVNAAGTGTLTFHTDKEWEQTVVGYSSELNAVQKHHGAELMVCYAFDTNAVSAFRGSTLGNDIVLTSSDPAGGQFTVSFAYAGYNSVGADDHANLPRHWRNLTLSGALVGTGAARDVDKLVLTGYSSTWANRDDQSYVTVLTLNEDTAGSAYERNKAGEVLNRFNGTVVLKNTINTSPLPSNDLDDRTAGTVQVVLKGDKLKEARLDLTREQHNMGAGFEETETHAGWYRQTYNNILVLNDDASVRGLTAQFRGIGWDYPETTAISGGVTKYYRDAMPQNDEVWHVRTVTNGLNTLRIGTYGDATDTNTYVYSGAMGFAQAYAGTAQGHIPWGDGFYQQTNASWKYGGHSMGVAEALSLVKSSTSTQYIHTALLNDVSVYEGTLGFNNLELAGNLNLVGGSRLELGTTGSMADDTTWNKIESDAASVMQSTYEKVLTSNTVEVHADKTMTVITLGTETLQDGKAVPQTAVVQGNVTLEGDANAHTSAALTFRLNNNVLPYSLNINQLDAQGNATGIISTAANEGNIVPLLTVTGNLTITNQKDIAVTLTGANFSLDQYGNKKYYLARADEIIIGSNGNEKDFVQRNISLGYGYFGILYTVGDNGSSLADDTDKASSYDYLVMSITGDPRRTWSGHVTQIPKNDAHARHVWFNTENKPEATEYDYRWKENKAFQEAHVVLFGNLYQPVEWTVQSELLSDQSVYVKKDVKHDGTTVRDRGDDLPTAAAEYDFNIDGYSLESVTAEQAAAYNIDYQAVRVDGAVNPFSIIINSDYYLCSGDGYTTKVLTTDDTNYYFYTTYRKDADGNIIEDSIGRIEDASPGKLEAAGFDGSWKTMLHKSGTGTTVIALDNSFSGGSVLQGGRLVMQHRNALGTGGITLMNGAALQGDFLDENMSDTGSSLGRAMDSTTIANTVTVNVYADPGNADYDSIVDGRLINSYNKKLILTKLVGESDTVLELNGVGLAEGDKYRYGVFKVLDPSGFAGTITMSGHVWGHVAVDETIGGMVQLDIMSTTKSADGADWTKAVVDLSVNKGTDRTVLALDATGEAPAGGTYEYCLLDSITGSINTTTGSSSVLNISAHNPITLVLKGLRNGDYDGVLGYGDFQVAVNYGGYAEAEQGTTRHHYGAVGHGSLNVIKEGEGSLQKVQRAWLNGLTVEGGTFQVEEALVAHDIEAGRGKRVMVGNADVSSLYALTVGAGGTLAMNTTFAESGKKQDAWAKLEGGSTDGDSNRWVAWVLLENGATLSAREDWYTARQVDIASGAAVTINTHNFAIDPYINEDNDPFGKYRHSHIIQLLGKITGQNVTLTLNNQLTNPAEKDAVRTDVASEYMGYVAIMDHNDFTGSNHVKVEAMTALQILGSNDNVEADVDMTVRGKHATVQVVDGQTQYIDSVVLGANNLEVSNADPLDRPNNGQIILGGQEVTTLVPDSTNYRQEPDKAGAQVFIAARHDETPLQLQSDARAVVTTPANQEEAAISHLHIDLSGAAVRMGGEEGHASVASNAHVDVVDKVTTHVIHDTDFLNSIIHLQEDCSINIAEAVLLDYQSVVAGSVVDQSAGVVSPLVGPAAATGQNNESWTKEVTTSRATTVQLTFADAQKGVYQVGDSTVLVLQTDQFQGVDLTDNSLNGFSGLTIQLYEDMIAMGYQAGAQYIALMVDGGSGRFLYEQDNQNFDKLLDSEFVLQDRNGNNMEGYWISSTTVEKETGAANVSMHMLYFRVPEPATTTLSLLALTALCARRRRK